MISFFNFLVKSFLKLFFKLPLGRRQLVKASHNISHKLGNVCVCVCVVPEYIFPHNLAYSLMYLLIYVNYILFLVFQRMRCCIERSR